MCPRSGFRSGWTCERTLVPVFRSGGTSECTLVPVFVPGENHPFGKPPFWKTTLKSFVNPWKGVFWKRGLFRKVHFLEIPENLENPQTVERKKGISDHFLEILSAHCQGAGGKGPRQKTSKIVKKCQKVFRQFSRRTEKKKTSKIVTKFFDTFRQFSRSTILLAPFGGLWF